MQGHIDILTPFDNITKAIKNSGSRSMPLGAKILALSAAVWVIKNTIQLQINKDSAKSWLIGALLGGTGLIYYRSSWLYLLTASCLMIAIVRHFLVKPDQPEHKK